MNIRSAIHTTLFACLLAILPGATVVAQRIEIPPPPPDPLEHEPPPPEEDEQVELSANLVTVIVTVRDSAGALVTDLNPSDFVVYEDGKPQEIDQFFRQDELPLRLALLFDSSLSIKKRLDFERLAAARFFTAALRPGDQAALVSVSTEWKLEQDLTGSPSELQTALGRLEAEGITALNNAIDGTARRLGAVDGRRVMVLLSDGYDTANKLTLDDALAAAQRSDVVVYAISTNGPAASGDRMAKIGESALKTVCEQTGGIAFFPPIESDPARESASLDAFYQRLINELRAQFVLTYYSTSPPADGQYRNVRVEVKRPGLSVTARKGYYGKKGD